MRLRSSTLTAAAIASLAGGLAAHAQIVAPAFAQNYTIVDLGSPAGVLQNYGGLTLKFDDPTTLLIGGSANGSAGQIWSIHVTRGAGNHITGFSGTATVFCEAAYNDGGVTNGPGHVLFLARWPVNELGQTKAGSTITDKIINLAPLGIATSISSINFVPVGYPGAGRCKISTYSGGEWWDLALTADGTGTYDVSTATQVPASQLSGSPEGFTYVPLGSPLFPQPSLIVAEYGQGSVATYEINGTGDPIIATRREFISGLAGAEGSFIDPVTGDFLFSTFGGGSHVLVVRGFTPPPPCYANCDGTLNPPYLNVNDFGCFLNRYAAGDPWANCDGSTSVPTLNVNDFQCFLNKYAAGCF